MKKYGFCEFQMKINNYVDCRIEDGHSLDEACELTAKDLESTAKYVRETYLSYRTQVIMTK